MGLSPLGHKQAAAVADWMTGVELDAVYASPMLRVKETMAPLLERRGISPVVIPGLREVDFGDWTGYRWEGVQERFGVSAFDWLEIIDGGGIPNGETGAELVHRVLPAVNKILQDTPHKSAAIYCHGGIIRVILALLLDMPLRRMAHFNIDYGSVSVVEIQPEKKHAVEIELMGLCPLRDAVPR